MMKDARPSPARETTPRRPCVMVVDDDEGVHRMLDAWLRSRGFSVWLAATGQEALELYRRHEGTIDVVLMDVLMPGLDGPRTLVMLKTLEPEVPCRFMSGNLGKYREAELLGLGAARVIAKPLRLDAVARVLPDMTGQRALEPDKTQSPVASTTRPLPRRSPGVSVANR